MQGSPWICACDQQSVSRMGWLFFVFVLYLFFVFVTFFGYLLVSPFNISNYSKKRMGTVRNRGKHES